MYYLEFIVYYLVLSRNFNWSFPMGIIEDNTLK